MCGNLNIILARVKNKLSAQFPVSVQPRQFVDDLTTTVVANSEDDVETTICSVVLTSRDGIEKGKLTLRKSKSKIVSHRNGFADNFVNEVLLPMTDAARDVKVFARKSRTAAERSSSTPQVSDFPSSMV